MNIKQFAEKEGLDETVPSLLLTFPECSPVVLGGLVGQLGEFGTYWYLTTVKEYRKKLNLKGFASVDVNVIKEISGLDHEKFLELYAGGLKLPPISKTSNSYARTKPTSLGGSANAGGQPGNYQYWVQDEHGNWSRGAAVGKASDIRDDGVEIDPTKLSDGAVIPLSVFPRTSEEEKNNSSSIRKPSPQLSTRGLADLREIIDRILAAFEIVYQEFLSEPRKPVAIQKSLVNFAGKEDRVKLIVTVAKPLPFALVNKETDTLEVTTDVPELNASRIKLGAMKLFCLETIASLGRKLGLEEQPDAVIDGFNLSSIRLSNRFNDSYQVASLQWYIPVSKAAAIYFQAEIRVPSPAPSPFFNNAIFRQAPKYKE